MSSPRSLRIGASLVVFALFGLPSAADACSVCMGDSGSKSAEAINNAIFLMLGFIGFMLCGIGAFAFHLMRRAGAPVPPHEELAQSLNQESSIV